MELRSLRYFLAVCREGNMSRAAQKLHVTQPTLSRQIADLERELGTSLLVRHNRSVEPTEAGLFLLERAADIVMLADRTSDDIRKGFANSEGSIAIVANDAQGMSAMGPIIRNYQKSHPQVRFHFHHTDSERALERLAYGIDDFAVLIGCVPSRSFERMQLEPVGPMGVFLPENDPLLESDPITRDDLAHKPLVVPQRTFTFDRDAFFDWFGTTPEDLNILGTYTHGRTGAILVNEQLGYMIGTEGMAPHGDSTGIEFRFLEPPVWLQVDFVWRRDRLSSPVVREFQKAVAEAAS